MRNQFRPGNFALAKRPSRCEHLVSQDNLIFLDADLRFAGINAVKDRSLTYAVRREQTRTSE